MWRIFCDIVFFYLLCQVADGVPLNFRSFRINPSLSMPPNATYNFSFKAPGINNPSTKNKITDNEPERIRYDENEIQRSSSREILRNDEMYDLQKVEVDTMSSLEDSYGNSRSRLTTYSAVNMSPRPDNFYSQRMSHDKYLPINTKNYTFNFVIGSTTAQNANADMEKSYYKPQTSDGSQKPVLTKLKLGNLLLNGPSEILANLASLTSTTQAPLIDQNNTMEVAETSYQIKGRTTQERERMNKLKRDVPVNWKGSYNIRIGDSGKRPCKPILSNIPLESMMEMNEDMTGWRDGRQFKSREVPMDADNSLLLSGEPIIPLQMSDREQKLHEMTDDLVLNLHELQQNEEYLPVLSKSKKQRVLEMLEMHIKGIGAKKKMKRESERFQAKEIESEQKLTVIDDTRKGEEERIAPIYNIYEESFIVTEGPLQEDVEHKGPDAPGDTVTSQYSPFLQSELNIIQNKYRSILSHFLAQIRAEENRDSENTENKEDSVEPQSSETAFEYLRKFRSSKSPVGVGRLNMHEFF